MTTRRPSWEQICPVAELLTIVSEPLGSKLAEGFPPVAFPDGGWLEEEAPLVVDHEAFLRSPYHAEEGAPRLTSLVKKRNQYLSEVRLGLNRHQHSAVMIIGYHI